MNETMITQPLFETIQQQQKLPGWKDSLRQTAWQAWQGLSVPTIKEEIWKYTSLSRWQKLNFSQPSVIEASFNLQDIPMSMKGSRFCFVDGVFNTTLSSPLQESHYLLSQRDWPNIPSDKQWPISYFERLNAALLYDGLYLDITEQPTQPIYLVMIAKNTAGLEQYHLRHHIRVRKNIRCELVIIDWSTEDATSFSTQFMTMDIEEGASLDCVHVKNQNSVHYRFNYTTLFLEKESRAQHFNLDLGARLSRNEVTALLQEEKSDCQLNGLAVALGHDHIDNQTKIKHLAANTHSEEHYRGIVDNKACHVFHGHVFVDEHAPGSIANQQNKNILLASTASAYAEPQLEIYNQNVQCIHGATVGDLDTDALFYLRSRGLSDKAARQLLISGFARHTLETIQDITLQKELTHLLRHHLTLEIDTLTELDSEMHHEHPYTHST